MPIFAVGDKVPQIHPSAFIAPTATIVGDVRIGAGASVWYGAVVRGDTSCAVIGVQFTNPTTTPPPPRTATPTTPTEDPSDIISTSLPTYLPT